MPKYEVRYLSSAEKDLLDIFAYIRRDSPKSAASFIGKVDKTIGRLAAHPFHGAVPKDERLAGLGYRILVIDKILVFCVIKPPAVQIRRILHGARRFAFLLE